MAKVGVDKIWENVDVKLFRITMELKSDKNVLRICSKLSRKLSVLARMSKFLTLEKSSNLLLSHSLNSVHSSRCFTADWCIMIMNQLLSSYL